jgi:hypothetical protein
MTMSAFDCYYAGTIMLAQLGVLGNTRIVQVEERTANYAGHAYGWNLRTCE